MYVGSADDTINAQCAGKRLLSGYKMGSDRFLKLLKNSMTSAHNENMVARNGERDTDHVLLTAKLLLTCNFKTLLMKYFPLEETINASPLLFRPCRNLHLQISELPKRCMIDYALSDWSSTQGREKAVEGFQKF